MVAYKSEHDYKIACALRGSSNNKCETIIHQVPSLRTQILNFVSYATDVLTATHHFIFSWRQHNLLLLTELVAKIHGEDSNSELNAVLEHFGLDGQYRFSKKCCSCNMLGNMPVFSLLPQNSACDPWVDDLIPHLQCTEFLLSVSDGRPL